MSVVGDSKGRPVRMRWERGVWWHMVRTEARRSYQMPYHDHDFAELFWLVAGSCNHLLNGVAETLTKGEAVFLRPADAHREGVKRDGEFAVTVISFDRRVMEALRRRHPAVFGVWWPARAADVFRWRLGDGQLGALNEAAIQLSRMPPTRFSLEWFLYQAAHIWQPAGPDHEMLPRLPDWLARAVAEFRRESSFRDGVGGLVRLAGRSHEHVTRTCRKHMGMPPVQLVRHLRVEEAKLRLTMTGAAAGEIADSLGFGSESHFFRVFRDATGMTPTRYRRGGLP